MARLTRRQLAALIAAAPALAQNSAPPATNPHFTPAPRSVEDASKEVKHAGEKLRAIDVPIAVEPAFVFKA